jgi:hypothetical protein
MMSRAAFGQLSGRVRAWQDGVSERVRDADLDIVRISPDAVASDLALAALVAERRLKKVA